MCSNFITNSRRILSCYQFNFLELLAVKTKFFNKMLLSWRRPVFLNEIKMANVKSSDKVLLIGSGIFPSEAIIIAQETGAKVIGIDNSPVAVKHAKRYVNKNKLNDVVEIKLVDGSDIKVKNFNVIFIAINVFPIDGVLLNISKDLKTGLRVLCKSMKNDIPDTLNRTGLSEFFEIKEQIKNPQTQSFLLVKK